MFKKIIKSQKYLVTTVLIFISWTVMATISSKENGITLTSGKRNSYRSYIASTEKIIPYPIETVKKAITNFKDKCNNQFKDKRKFTPQNFHCKYHNNNLVETFEIKNLKNLDIKDKNVEISILGRQVYNRGMFSYYELLKVEEIISPNNEKKIIISGKMLSDSEAKKFISPDFKKESAFNDAHWSFELVQKSTNSTLVNYEYNAQTDHWLLNKEISVPQVFRSISASVHDLINSVEMGAANQIDPKENVSQASEHSLDSQKK